MTLKKLLLCLVFLSGTSFAHDELTIGCATKCDFFFRHALRVVAKKHNVKIRLVDISSTGSEVVWGDYHGIIFPGGADVDPKYYLPYVESDLQEYTSKLDHLVNYTAEGRRRDPIEFGLLEEFFAKPELKSMPILGVCRGMQVLAVSQKIPLYVDIKAELGIRNRRYLFDRIELEPGSSVLNELFQYDFKGFKRHHQGVRVSYFQENIDRWPHIKLTSFSNRKRIAESLEFVDRPILGVQFHPENDFGFERNRIFGWLIKQALLRKEELGKSVEH